MTDYVLEPGQIWEVHPPATVNIEVISVGDHYCKVYLLDSSLKKTREKAYNYEILVIQRHLREGRATLYQPINFELLWE